MSTTGRLEKARPLIHYEGEKRCGHCASVNVELAELQTGAAYEDHEGPKRVCKPAYLCLDCGKASLAEPAAIHHLLKAGYLRLIIPPGVEVFPQSM